MQGICAWLTRGSRSSSGCSSMQSIYTQLIGGFICLLYISIVLDLAVAAVVCKASMLNWLGVHLPSIYMPCTISSRGCSSMQGIYAQWTGGPSAFYIYIHCTISSSGCSSMQGIYVQLIGGVHLSSIYMPCTISSTGCSSMQGIYAQLTGGPSAFYIYVL